MKAPDKIYVAEAMYAEVGFFGLWTDKDHRDKSYCEYIRKDALLDWARAKHMELDPPQNERDFGRIEAVEELIDKINSL